MLNSRLGSLEGLRVADLYAGSGALGLEALSRGAAFCLFVERDRAAIEHLRGNIARFGAQDRTDIRASAVERVAAPIQPFDLLLFDPPYTGPTPDLERFAGSDWLAPGGWISLENDGRKIDCPVALTLEAERRFGRATIRLFRKKAGAAE